MMKKILLVLFVLSVIVFGLSTNAKACVTSSFSVDNYSPDVNEDVTVDYDPSSLTNFGEVRPETWAWDFGEDAVPATASTEGPHVIHYTSAGEKTIQLDVTGIGAFSGVLESDSSSQTLNSLPVAVPISIVGSFLAMLAIGGGIFFRRKRAMQSLL